MPAQADRAHGPIEVCRAPRGMVVAGESLTASAGLAALASGGNAVDAALAMAGASAVTLPEMCGLGGDAFALVYEAATRRVTAYTGCGPAPAAASVGRYRASGHETMPMYGWWSVAVPGAVAVYDALHADHARLPLTQLWAPAVALACDGFPANRRLAAGIEAEQERLAAEPALAATYLRDGAPLGVGATVRHPDLADSLRAVAAGGAEVFYRGEIATAIAAASRAGGGLLTLEDLGGDVLDVGPPITTTYRGRRVHQTPLPTQGLILLEALNIVEGYDLGSTTPEADRLHVLVEALRFAFADRSATMGDPRFVDAPLDRLLSKDHAALRRSQLDPSRATASVSTPLGGGDTTSFVAVDDDGNAVSLIQSLSHRWGAGVVAGDTGIVLNNRAGRGFTLDEASPNVLAPGKRPMHTLNTWLVTDDTGSAEDAGELVLVGNSPGGDGQPQWGLQAIVHCLDLGMDPAHAACAPRWMTWPGAEPSEVGATQLVLAEARVPAAVRDELQRRGHELRVLSDWGGFGALCLIRRRDDHWEGAADPRDGGAAIGW